VRTASATFRDIGTVFSVHSDRSEGARIVVSEGTVAVQGLGADSTVTALHKGDRASVTVNGSLHVERSAAAAEDTAWTAGKLLFRDASVAQVVADVRRWYGIDLRVDSSLVGHHVSAEFDRSGAADVGRVVAAMLGGGFRQDGSTIYIVPAPAGAAK
jgi:transmembrane sensor